MSASPTFARIRRQVLARPGFTRLPVCNFCLKEIALLDYARHVAECEKASKEPTPAAQAPVNGATDASPTPRQGLVYGLFDKTAVARLEDAGKELAQLRQQLRAEHHTTTPEERVERCRAIAQLECLTMALILDRMRAQFRNQGSGMIFLRNLKPHVIDDHLREACAGLTCMGDPEAWKTS